MDSDSGDKHKPAPPEGSSRTSTGDCEAHTPAGPATDAVFGEITEDGPNYRGVSSSISRPVSPSREYTEANVGQGWDLWSDWADDEVASRPRYSVYPSSLRRSWPHPRHHMLMFRGCDDDLVWLGHRRL